MSTKDLAKKFLQLPQELIDSSCATQDLPLRHLGEKSVARLLIQMPCGCKLPAIFIASSAEVDRSTCIDRDTKLFRGVESEIVH